MTRNKTKPKGPTARQLRIITRMVDDWTEEQKRTREVFQEVFVSGICDLLNNAAEWNPNQKVGDLAAVVNAFHAKMKREREAR